MSMIFHHYKQLRKLSKEMNQKRTKNLDEDLLARIAISLEDVVSFRVRIGVLSNGPTDRR
jgi:hypothetical protein